MADKIPNIENVYTFKNVKFTTTETEGGNSKDWCVSYIEIVLVENGIPKIELHVDPMHKPDDSTGASSIEGLKTFAAWNLEVQRLASIKANALLEFEVWRGDKKDQSFAIEDWIVTEGGLLTGHGNFELVIVIQHPLVLANFFSTSISNLAVPETPMTDAILTTDMVEAIASTLELYAISTFNTVSTEPPCANIVAQEPEVDIAAQFASEMSELTSTIRTELKWNGGFYDLPGGTTYAFWPVCNGELTSSVEYMGISLAHYFWGLRDTNVWDIIAQQIVGHWCVSILPTYWKALTLTPTTPWAKPSIVIDDTNISESQFPGYERNIIAGVVLYMQGPNSGVGYTDWLGGEADEEQMTDGVVYRLPNNAIGAIEDHNVPGWLSSVMMAAASASGEYGASNQASSNMVTPSNTPQGNAPDATTGNLYLQSAEEFRCALYHCAHQIFLTQFKSGTQANVSMRLMLSQKTAADNHDDDIIPGKSCRITSKGQAVLDFYITMVVHRIDFAHSVADTTLAGKYVRPPNGFENLLDTTSTVPNPAYVELAGAG